jgi:outer membrane receptor protein involved in Fe transport
MPLSEPGEGYTTPAALLRVQPDTADNYEIGVKGTVANRVRYSAAIFDIQWHNLQEGADLTALALPGAINLGEAYSRGFESEISANVTEHISGQLDYTYDMTKVTRYSPLALGAENLSVELPPLGGPLPGTPKNSVALGLEYGHLAVAGGNMRFALNGRYQSGVLSAISETTPPVPGYWMLDARASYAVSHWVGTLYVDNLTNALGITAYSDPGNWGKYYEALISRPRTAGVSVAYSFK